MRALAIHTSSPELGLALLDETGTRQQVWPLGRDLTTYLHTCLSEFIQPHDWRNLTFVAVARGPGGFTGTRIGVVTARTLAQSLNIPLFGISSLAAIAQQHRLSEAQNAPIQPGDRIAVEMKAQRGDVFGAIYRVNAAGLSVVVPDQARSRTTWEASLQSEAPQHHFVAAGGLAASVGGVLSLAVAQWQAGDRPDAASVLPFYGQHPVDAASGH